MAQYLYVSTLPSYVQSKTHNLALVGVVLSMYGLWQAIIRVPLGIAADWIGWRKPFILVGLALVGVGAWTMGTTDTTNGLIVGRAISGLAAGAWVPLVVAFSSLFPPEETVRASAMLTLLNSVGRIVASATNGPLNNVGGYSLALYAATGIAMLSVVITLSISEARRPPLRPSASSLGQLFARKDVLVPSLLSALGQYANFGINLAFFRSWQSNSAALTILKVCWQH